MSPILMVMKRDGSYRFCVDYRKLNTITKTRSYPILSKFDLRTGFWQKKIRVQDREKTSFICPQGTFMFNVMPFGLKNAPYDFQRDMEDMLREYSYIADPLKSIWFNLRWFLKNYDLRPWNFLGHRVSKDGIKPDPNNVKNIEEMEAPINIRGIRRFIGSINMY